MTANAPLRRQGSLAPPHDADHHLVGAATDSLAGRRRSELCGGGHVIPSQASAGGHARGVFSIVALEFSLGFWLASYLHDSVGLSRRLDAVIAGAGLVIAGAGIGASFPLISSLHVAQMFDLRLGLLLLLTLAVLGLAALTRSRLRVGTPEA